MAVHRVMWRCAVGMVALGLTSPVRAGEAGPEGARSPAGVGVSPAAMRAAQVGRPLAFEQNAGQVDPQVRFLARGPGGLLWFTDAGVTMSVRSKTAGSTSDDGAGTGIAPVRADVVRMSFVASLPGARISAEGVQSGRTNYLRGRDPSAWTKGVKSFSRVRYAGVFPGIDVVFHGDRGSLEYDVLVAPGADPTVVGLRFEGAEGLRLDDAGRLVLRTRVGELVHKAPVAWQDGPAGRVMVSTRFALRADGSVGFEVAAFDRSRPLVVDPTLQWANFLGGSGGESAQGLAVDASGNIVVSGSTASTDFPATGSAYDQAFGGGTNSPSDAFLAQYSADGSTLNWATYLGGTGFDNAGKVALDGSGNVFLCGNTSSTDFPVTTGAYQGTFVAGPAGASWDGFIVELDSSGSNLLYGTYIGGAASTILKSIAVDANGNAYVTGNARAGFPVTPGAFDSTQSGATVAQIVFAKVAPAGNGANDLLYGTYISGDLWGIGWDIAVDGSGDAYIAGSVTSSSATGYVFAPYPTTANAYKPIMNVKKQTTYDSSVFTKIRPGGNGAADLLYSTFIAGPDKGYGSNDARGIAVDAQGRAYVAGTTPNGTPLVTTANAYDRTQNGSLDGFLAVFDPSKSGAASYVYATVIGGDGQDECFGVALDTTGRVLLTGWSGSKKVRYPTTSGAVQAAVAGGLDATVTVLDLSKSGAQQLAYSTYFGGTTNDLGYRVAGTPDGGFVIAGYASGGNGFPTGTSWPNDGTYNGGGTDCLVVKFGN